MVLMLILEKERVILEIAGEYVASEPRRCFVEPLAIIRQRVQDHLDQTTGVVKMEDGGEGKVARNYTLCAII